VIFSHLFAVLKTQVFQRIELWLARVPSTTVRWLIILVLLMLQSLNLYKADTYDRLVGSSYDTLLRKRLVAPPIDQSIVILDIDERSLNKMATDYGRWPWPRDTLASVLDYLERGGAKAVVFDILFSDADVINQVADATFADSVARSQSAFFPILRLDRTLDKASEVDATMLPGFATRSSQTTTTIKPGLPAPRLAVIPPVFDAVVSTGRLGFHNIYPDIDGVNRHYRLWEDVSGNWQLNSLPARIAQDFGWRLPDAPDQLLSFQINPDAYPTVSFFDIWVASQRQDSAKLATEFKDKIVIIGSTAPNLFDVKVTPLSPIQSGVQVLANAIDNVKNNSFLQTLNKTMQWLISAALLILMAYGSKKLPVTTMRWAILLAPSALIGISFLTLNFGTVFVDLTAAASQAFVFFTVMTVYGAWRIQIFSTPPKPKADDNVRISIVFGAKSTSLNLSEIIDSLTQISKNFAVVQSGFTAGTTVGAGGPFCAILCSPNPISQEQIRSTLFISENAPVMIEMLQVSTKDIANLSFADSLADVAWPLIGKALVTWEKKDEVCSP